MLNTAQEDEYFNHDVDYEENYTEWLELHQGFIVAHFEEKWHLLGIGDCSILDISKHILLRAPRVSCCGLVFPMIPCQGFVFQPRDYLTYYDTMMERLDRFRNSSIMKSRRCLSRTLDSELIRNP